MKIAILDDYQDVVRRLDCFPMLDGHEVKVFTNSARGAGQLAIRLAPFDALVLIRERTPLTRALLTRLPNLKLISQTGKVSGHIDLSSAAECGITITEGVGDPTAPAELTWALIMSAMRKLPHYINNLKSRTRSAAASRGALSPSGGTAVSAGRSLRMAKPSAWMCWSGEANPVVRLPARMECGSQRRVKPSLRRAM